MMSTSDLCPCTSGKSYQECCAPYHQGTPAPSPELLMRSRYTAFVHKNADYLLATGNPTEDQEQSRKEVEDTFGKVEWLGLHVVGSGIQADPTLGFVQFAAFCRSVGGHTISQIHEKSSFRLLDGKWHYLDGTFLPLLKFGRNDPCWCGSGQKYKKCHGK